MKKFPLLVILAALIGCSSTTQSTTQQTSTNLSLNKNSDLKKKNTIDIKRKKGEITLKLPKNAELISLRLKQGNYWKKLPIKVHNNTVYLSPGTYKYELKISGAQGAFKETFQLEKNQKLAYIHSTLTPNNKTIFTWFSMVAKNTPSYKNEKLSIFCLSLSEKSNYSAIAPTYALNACKKLAEKNNVKAIAQLGLLYKYGILLEKNEEKSLQLLRQAYDLGNQYAGVQLALSLSKKRQDASKIYMDLANKDNIFSMGALSFEYMYGSHLKKNKEKAKYWALEASKKGDIYSFTLMPEIITETSSTVEPNYIEAMAWIIAFKRSFNDQKGLLTNNFFNVVENELTEDDIEQAEKRSLAVLSNLGSLYSGTLYITNLANNPYYKDKKIEIKINHYDKLYSISDNKQTIIPNLLNSNEVNKIEIYLDGEMTSYREINFHDNNSSKLCWFYNDDTELDEISPVEEVSICKG